MHADPLSFPVKCNARHICVQVGTSTSQRQGQVHAIEDYRQESMALHIKQSEKNSIIRLTAVPGTRLLRYRRRVEWFLCT
jgi:hypothetical protein